MMQDNDYWNRPAPGASEPVEAGTATASASEQGAWAWEENRQAVGPDRSGGERHGAPAYAPAAPAQARQGKGWIVGIVIAVCMCAVMLFGIQSCSNTFASFATLVPASSSGTAATAPNSIAVIEISGTIQYDGTACSPEGLKQLLDEAEDDDNIKAVVLRVNSGGGTATAGEEMAEYVAQFSKPIVVSSASINASAAYEISSQADYIFVARSTEIGAIGTAMQLTDLSGLLDKLGISMDVITSSDEKDSSYGYRPLTDAERAYYQDMVDQINQVFIENVAAGRGMAVSEVEALATGMPFTGTDAVANGLADAVGTREDACDKAAELAGLGTDYTVCSLDFSYAMSIYDLLWDYDLSARDLIDIIKEHASDVRIK